MQLSQSPRRVPREKFGAPCFVLMRLIRDRVSAHKSVCVGVRVRGGCEWWRLFRYF